MRRSHIALAGVNPGRIWSVFVEGVKPENPEKKPSEHGEHQQQTRTTYDTGLASNPDYIDERQALSPVRHPSSPKKTHLSPQAFTVKSFS